MNINTLEREIDEQSISKRINIIDNNTIEYKKRGHGTIRTNRPLCAVRLELAIDESGLTQTQLAKLANTTQPTISRIVDGKAKRSVMFPQIAKSLGIDCDWLSGLTKDVDDIARIENNVLRISNEAFIRIPAYAKDEDRENAQSSILISPRSLSSNTNTSHLSFIKAEDKSNAPNIMQNSTVIFNSNEKELVSGDLFVVQHGDMILIRALYKDPNHSIRLRSKNPEYPEYVLDFNDDQFKILGRVVFVMNAY